MIIAIKNNDLLESIMEAVQRERNTALFKLENLKVNDDNVIERDNELTNQVNECNQILSKYKKYSA